MNTTNKRVRFTHQSETNMPKIKTSGDALTPKAASITSVRNFAATLRKHLSPIILTAGLTHIDLLHKWSTKCRQHGKMDADEEFIPRSARLVNFDFRVPRPVEASEEFQEVQAETNLLIKEFRLNLKGKIMDALKIDILLQRTALYSNLVKVLHSTIQAKLLSDNKTASAHVILSTIIHYHEEALLDSFDTNKVEFCHTYREHHALQEFPFPNAHVSNQDDTTMPDDGGPPPQQEGAQNQTQAVEERDLARICLDVISSTILRPTKTYFNRLEEIETDLSLKKLHFEAETEDTAAATKARLDLEASATPELVRDLIRGQVDKEIKNYRSEVGQLKRQLAMLTTKGASNAKNLRGGHGTTSGASKTKEISKSKRTQRKKTSPTSPRTGNQSQRAPTADAQGNATSSVNARKSKGKNRKKNTRRN